MVGNMKKGKNKSKKKLKKELKKLKKKWKDAEPRFKWFGMAQKWQ